MRTASLASLLLCSGALAQQTFLVDTAGGPGSHFTDLPTAVAAVPDGSILHVRAGTYDAFPSLSKGLTISGESKTSVVVRTSTPYVLLGPTTSSQEIVLANLSFDNSSTIVGPLPSLRAIGCQGSLVLEDVELRGRAPFAPFTTEQALRLESCPNVHWHRVRIDFPEMRYTGSASAAATVHVLDSELEIVESTIFGIGGSANWAGGAPGMSGLRIEGSSHVQISASRIRGGAGGSAGPGLPNPPATDGGHGVEVLGAEATVLGRAVHELSGGSGGYQGTTLAGRGGHGVAVRLGARVALLGVTPVPGPSVSYFQPSPVFVDGASVATWDPNAVPPITAQTEDASTVTWTLLTQPGEIALPFLGAPPIHLPLLPELPGTLFCAPVIFLPAQTVPVSGTLSVTLPFNFDFPKDRAVSAQFVVADPAITSLRLSPSCLVVRG
jgi:hypothetical protein